VPHQRSTGQFQLKPTQQRVLGVLKSEGTSRLTRAGYEELAGVSRSQAAYDLAELVEAGILERLGGGRATRYRIVNSTSAPARKGRRRWTQERIRSALEEFCGDRDEWPSAAEFKQAGHFDLYVAASRYGGIRFWTTELGFPRERQTVPAPAPARRRRVRPRLTWVPAAVVATLALAAAGAGHLRLSPGGTVFQSSPKVIPAPTLRPPTAHERAKLSQPARRVSQKPAKASRPARSRSVTHAATTQSSSTQLASVQSGTPSSTASAQTTAPARTTSSSPTPTSSSNPAPLPAPSGGNAARPLPPPRR
jgi:hypothetical protein